MSHVGCEMKPRVNRFLSSILLCIHCGWRLSVTRVSRLFQYHRSISCEMKPRVNRALLSILFVHSSRLSAVCEPCVTLVQYHRSTSCAMKPRMNGAMLIALTTAANFCALDSKPSCGVWIARREPSRARWACVREVSAERCSHRTRDGHGSAARWH